jgi:outer membrane receptor protein involved in Fe transport
VAVNVETVNRHYKLNYIADLKDAGVIDLSYYHNDEQYKAAGNDFSSFGLPPIDSDLDVGKVSWLVSPVLGHTFRFAAEARHGTISGELIGNNGDSDDSFSMNVYSVSQMWNWDVTDKLRFTQALRLDKWETDSDADYTLVDPFLNVGAMDRSPGSTEFSYNLGAVYSYDSENIYRLTASRGLRIPSLVELSQSFFTLPAEVYGNPSLQPAINTTYSASYSHEFGMEALKTAKATIFRQEISDLISQTGRAIGGSGGALADFTYENAGDSTSYGLEMGFDGTIIPGELTWHANYTLMFMDDDDDGIAGHYINFSHTEPQHRLNIGLDYTKGAYEVVLDAHYVSGADYTAVIGDSFAPNRFDEIDGYFILNTTVGYNVTESLLLQLTGLNLVDKHQERPTFVYTGESAVLGSNEIGRTVLFTVKQQF